ncbi:hypothetical protein GLAREA_09915 [Glarea lozoyensis ATCC 20868]|uniref:Uncharacterized protein n=1 Tax=Glarea lozoyensis (strain ATCC 20868 / MF5171) TaxID=1116229 RepID=S3CV16_GLAL2|nr:uncharacterized protein GLAREA_09915 [Glarea lozoyensis ATCC 20868]EPE28794.1 hypothetical protein GLAREA_09915 [Glarea lozoyensis ATCC 20868]
MYLWKTSGFAVAMNLTCLSSSAGASSNLRQARASIAAGSTAGVIRFITT